jgi:predicted lipoprotein with Yx(FWY)xxD motif
MRIRWWAAPCLAAVAAMTVAACGSSAPSSSPSTHAATGKPPAPTSSSSTSAAGIKTMSTSKGTVLASAQGRTLYWFAIDTPTKSNCTGTCVQYWLPLTGKPSAAAGVSLPGKFGTIKDSNGKTQATYDGHPLYLYVGDTAAGQVSGNGLNLSGGLWWAMTPSGAKLAAHPSSSPSSGGGYGGY